MVDGRLDTPIDTRSSTISIHCSFLHQNREGMNLRIWEMQGFDHEFCRLALLQGMPVIK
jgi:hypothetical protein